jgi:hypothetical protein
LSPPSISIFVSIGFIEDNIVNLRSVQTPSASSVSSINLTDDPTSDVKADSYENLPVREKWVRFLSNEIEGKNTMKALNQVENHLLEVPEAIRWTISVEKVAEKIALLLDPDIQSYSDFIHKNITTSGRSSTLSFSSSSSSWSYASSFSSPFSSSPSSSSSSMDSYKHTSTGSSTVPVTSPKFAPSDFGFSPSHSSPQSFESHNQNDFLLSDQEMKASAFGVIDSFHGIDDEMSSSHHVNQGLSGDSNVNSGSLGSNSEVSHLIEKYYHHLQITMLTYCLVQNCFLSFDKPMN